MFRIRDILVRIWICGSVPISDPDPALFVSDLQDAFYFLKVHLHLSSKRKCHKKVTKQQNSGFFSIFLFDDGRIRIRISTSDYQTELSENLHKFVCLLPLNEQEKNKIKQIFKIGALEFSVTSSAFSSVPFCFSCVMTTFTLWSS